MHYVTRIRSPCHLGICYVQLSTERNAIYSRGFATYIPKPRFVRKVLVLVLVFVFVLVVVVVVAGGWGGGKKTTIPTGTIFPYQLCFLLFKHIRKQPVRAIVLNTLSNIHFNFVSLILRVKPDG